MPKAKTPLEKEVQAECLKWLNSQPNIWAWRRTIGMFRSGPRVIRVNQKGQSDIEGIIKIESGRQTMKDQLDAVKRDEVLFAFHRACHRPTTEQIAEWTKNYPEFAEDIRIHAAIRLDWEARPEEASEEPDDLLLRRGHSRALNAISNFAHGSFQTGSAGVHLEIETKREGNEPTDEQSAWMLAVQAIGGIALWCNSLDMLKAKLRMELDHRGWRRSAGG